MAQPLRSAVDLLERYAEYHRDRRNIVTHLVGVPLVVFAVGVLLARPAIVLAGIAFTPASAGFALVSLWYLTRGQFGLGAATAAGVGLLMAMAHQVGSVSGGAWLSWGASLFAAGWIVQFIGHYYEGRKPACADDATSLLVAPMFVVLELLAPLGLYKGLLSRIERHAGPTVIRDLAQPATW
jgi:uncharacterized membrane protein YGL010W